MSFKPPKEKKLDIFQKLIRSAFFFTKNYNISFPKWFRTLLNETQPITNKLPNLIENAPQYKKRCATDSIIPRPVTQRESKRKLGPELVKQCIIICKGRCSNPEHVTYSPYKVNSKNHFDHIVFSNVAKLLLVHVLTKRSKVVVVTHAYGKCSGVRHMTDGLKVYHVPRRPFFNMNTFPTLYGTLPIIRTIFTRERITVVHGHQTFSTLCIQ
ncbi:PIGA (GPI anchor biosynthesis) protein [Medicago truncatula]|uniref:PIGA (GPI anchor biosynthesis) protein n=1 Tax=Medicago truncatula TaxID=3880 RepID=G7ZWA5_MEDTR|nr:PIGA (GPI anchor biosynthesis) protein [Medicago truncatula]